MYRHIVWVPACLLLLSACESARIPFTENHPASYQKVVRATQHWDLLADDIASQTLIAIGTNKPIHVVRSETDTDFSRAFHHFLVSRMVARKMQVVNGHDEAVDVFYDVQVIAHNSSRRTHLPGTLSMLAGGLMVAYNVPGWNLLNDRTVAATAGVVAGDALLSQESGAPTRTELVVTTTALEGERYLMQRTDIYYLEPEDVPLFMKVDPLPPPPPAFPVREFKTVGAG